MSIWPKWVPVRGGDDLENAKKHGLAIRRIGSELEGNVFKVDGVSGHRKVTIVYPDHGNCEEGFKKGSIHIITDLEKYEFEPTLLIQEYLAQLGMAMERDEVFIIPGCQENRPDLDILGVFLENDALAFYLDKHNQEQLGEKYAVINRRKAKVIIYGAVDFIKKSYQTVWLWDTRCTAEFEDASIEKLKKLHLYFMEASLRILFWCYYCDTEAIESKLLYNWIVKCTASIMGDDKLPPSLRFRATRLVYFWGKKQEELPIFAQGYAEGFLGRITGLIPKQDQATKTTSKRKKIIKLAQYDLSGETGKRPEYFF